MTKFLCKIVAILFLVMLSVNCKGSKSANDNKDINVSYDSIIQKKVFLPVQIEYAKLLKIKPDSLENIKLYSFIDKWMNTPYLMGGETKKGIDCSSFTQLLYTEVYDKYIERTAEKQYLSKNLDRFKLKEFLEEGDLVFFKTMDKTLNKEVISHVGIYLKNNKFINATSYRGEGNGSGVIISDLSLPFWKKRFVAGGKRTDLR